MGRERNAPRPQHTASAEPLAYDVVIVGAGITGTLVAYELLRAGLRVVMFDKRDPGLGSTAASTGLLLYEPDMLMADIAKRHGLAAARRAYRLGRSAIREIRQVARRLRISCGWRSRSTLYLASTERDVPALRREAKDLRAAGLGVRVLSTAQLEKIGAPQFPAALLSSGSAEVDALRLTRGVLRACLAYPKFELREHTRVRSVRDESGGVVIRTVGGDVRAKFTIVASGYEIRGFVTTRLAQLHSTYVIASRPLSPYVMRRFRWLMWETARPYFYLRTTPDRRIVFGGLDDPFSTPSRRDRKLAAKARALERRFAELFPRFAFKADYAWTGAFADTSDGLPCIGPTRPGSRVLFALGYGGNGITFSQIAAKILRDVCLGKSNPDAAIFAFNRNGRRPLRRQR